MNRDIDLKDFFPLPPEKDRGKDKIGWFCTYTPEELIMAGGYYPVRLMGEKALRTAESYFPINFCPYLKSGWQSLMDSAGSLSGAVFTNSCDGMRRLFDIAEHYLKGLPVFMLDVPRRTDRESIDFFSLKLEDMLAFIEGLRGSTISPPEIADSAALCDRKRQALAHLSDLFFKGGRDLDISQYYRIMELAATADAADLTSGILSLNSCLKQAAGEKSARGPRIMVIGNFITEEKLWDLLSEMDLELVCDDLCISNRYYEKQVGTAAKTNRKDLLSAIALRYLTKPACMRMADTGAKIEDFKQKIRDRGVQGVVFISLKFCDTVLYSFPLIRKELAALKIPVLYLEIEYNNFSEGQVKTRLQAFLEMI